VGSEEGGWGGSGRGGGRSTLGNQSSFSMYRIVQLMAMITVGF